MFGASGASRRVPTATGGAAPFWLRGAVAVAIVASLIAGCSGGSTGPQSLTDDQAQQLSLARFTTYQLGTVNLRAAFTMNGTAVTLTGWVDYTTAVAYATSTEDGDARNLLMWDHDHLAVKQISGVSGPPPLPQPDLDSTWGKGSIDTTRSELQQILVVILELGADRPDNALLVRQNGARFVRTDRIDGTAMSVYAVPPNPTRGSTATGAAGASSRATADGQRVIDYWIGAAGAIRRVNFTLASGSDVTVDITPATGPDLRDPFGAPTAPRTSP